jgi:hypothetical protein
VSFKPKPVRPTSEELLSSVGRVAETQGRLPTAPPLPSPEILTVNRPIKAIRSRTVLVNFKATVPFAKLISELAEKEGGVRRLIARMLKEAGHEVPDQDLNPATNRRVYD